MKTCKHCGIEKPINEFTTSKRTKSGYLSSCKACDVLRVQKYKKSLSSEEKKQLAEKQRQYNQMYWKEKKQILKQKNADYKNKNKEKIDSYNKEYYQKNIDMFAEKTKAYRMANKGKVNAWVIARRKCLQQRTIPSQKQAIYEFYQNCPDGHHVDHIIPLTHPLVSGLHVLANLQYLPAKENCSKRNKFEVM